MFWARPLLPCPAILATGSNFLFFADEVRIEKYPRGKNIVAKGGANEYKDPDFCSEL